MSQQEELTTDDYKNLILDNLYDLNSHQLRALENIKAHRFKFYN